MLYIYRTKKAMRHFITGRERERFEAIIISFVEKYIRFAARNNKSRAEKNKRALFSNNYFFLVKAIAAVKCRPKIKAFSALVF